MQAEFRARVPTDPRVSTRPMFGSVAAFANGYMFMGLFANELFVRLPAGEREAEIARGAKVLEPMPGRAMKDYVVYGGDWLADASALDALIARALEHTLSLPPKK